MIVLAATLGATVAMLLARFLVHNWVQSRYGHRLGAVNHGIHRDGALYVLTLRLVPVMPFFVLNALMGITPIRVRPYFWATLVGMVPVTIVFANAGRQLAQLQSPAEVLSADILASLLLLAAFPWIARAAVNALRRRSQYRRWPKPKSFDRDLIVIGGGAAGLVAAYIGAALKARVTLVERGRMGGDCLNTGCVPSKTLIHSSRLAAELKRAPELGLHAGPATVDFVRVMERVRGVIRRIEPHDSAERYRTLGVECIHGDAHILSPWRVDCAGHELTTRSIVVASGAEPLVPPIPGLDSVPYLTSETVWSINELPRRLLVLGCGPIGSELAQAFARLGSSVTLVESASLLLPREDPWVSDLLQRRFGDEGMSVRLGHRAVAVSRTVAGGVIQCATDAGSARIEFDTLLVAVGRRARTQGFGLKALGIPLSSSGTVEVNDYLQTVYPNIYACGDAAGPYQFTHAAAHQAWYCAVNALAAPFRRFRADYAVLPRCTFTDPEVARVGLNETEAQARGIAFDANVLPFSALDRALTDGAEDGEMRVLTVPGRDRILGATIVGRGAGELIAEIALAMRHRLGLNALLRTVHAYPTMMEAHKKLAGEWRRAHAPESALRLLERYFAWRRG
jgi:pyruvate/2-oxoglutarate dehydrogenase complex dihydrolipoamide dehydrogenase (E3) component